MCDINLICTRHNEGGNCNSDTLFGIIESINPDIIFEELSKDNYDSSYKEQSLITLETSAIKKYLQYRTITHIPVDTYELPKYYYENIDQMHQRICSGIS